MSSVFNSRDLKSPMESQGGYMLLKNADQEVAQIMSEPESEKSDNVFIWRIDDDPPIATNGCGPLWLTRLATKATSWSAERWQDN